jgi:hypothetical protein
MNKEKLRGIRLAALLAIAVLIASFFINFVESESSSYALTGPISVLFCCLLFSFFIVLNFKVAYHPKTDSLERAFSVIGIFLFACGIVFLLYTGASNSGHA